MRQTHKYTSAQYNADNGFPIASWFRRNLRKMVDAQIKAEAEEDYSRSKLARSGKIIGRVAGPEAYLGKSSQIRTKEQEKPAKEDEKSKQGSGGK